MPDAVFPFPGGKSRLASWITDHLPDHECYVEVFGGAAGVLVNKDPDTSSVEVYNDRDADLVHFFRVLREQPDELVEWLDAVPYAREVHEQWADRFYQGYRPNDDISRAGQFFYLRYSQWGGAYDSNSGFATSKQSSRALSFANKLERLQAFADRFDAVVLENLDWRDAVEKYDGPDTVFYCDPPYVGKEDYYPVDDIDHQELADVLGGVEGSWLVSYSDLPDGFEAYHVLERDSRNYIGNGKSGSTKATQERLVVNFEPEQVATA